MSENIYLVYHEKKTDKWLNGNTVQCDTVKELIYQLQECEREGYQNIQVITIQNGKSQ